MRCRFRLHHRPGRKFSGPARTEQAECNLDHRSRQCSASQSLSGGERHLLGELADRIATTEP